MKVITNEKLVNRNRKIGQYTTLASLAILGLGLYLSFQTSSQTSVLYSFVALLLGFALSQIGIYFQNRWGRNPRPDQQIANSLKGLSESYTLFNFSSPVSHLLLGPTGLWIILPYHQNGRITYENGRWRQHGGNLYLKIFAQNNLGRPDLDIKSQVASLEKGLATVAPAESALPAIRPVILFMNEKAEVDAEAAPVPTLTVKKLKEYIRKRPKDPAMTPEKQAALESALSKS